MKKTRVFTVNFDLPGDEFEYVPFDSDQTLLDADIILVEPSMGYYDSIKSYNGKPLLTEKSSYKTHRSLDHWRNEIVGAVNAGKLVIVYLRKPVECFRYSGKQDFSGTGRSRVTTDIVTEVSSYNAVPNLKLVIPKSGTAVRIDKDAKFFSTYWKEFSAYSRYEVQIEGEFTNILLRTSAADKIVGASVHTKAGNLLFLPPLTCDEKTFLRYDSKTEQSYWTKQALQFGKKLVSELVNLANTLRKSRQATAPPGWAAASEYRLIKETMLEQEISSINAQISTLQAQRSKLDHELEKAGTLRFLLYEQGPLLEAAILEALTLFGFQASKFSNGESEFDVILECSEGRCLGEAEGKDNKPINIDKFSQLERNLQEDFAREDVSEFAKGVLFGNAYRLTPVHERGDFFTEKCLTAAKRLKVALVRTPDIFRCAKYLKEQPEDQDFAKQCRTAIISTEGAIVSFPKTPVDESSVVLQETSEDSETKPDIALNNDAS